MSESIKVAVRVRPYIHAYEKVDGIKCIISMNKELQQTSIEHPETGKQVQYLSEFDIALLSFETGFNCPFNCSLIHGIRDEKDIYIRLQL